LARQRHDAAHARYDTGFMLLDGPPAAYGSRLALVQAAQKTLDLQYYSITADPSTAELLKAVREAAGRGVRVRILLDDLHSSGKDAAVMEMAFVPNIEMRMFNPLAGARASSLGRMLSSIDDAERAQQRMHNKLFIADNVMAVSGGRNLGDAYFGKASDGNFVDLDVLTAGPLVQDLSRSFDAYWNNERAYPVQSLVSKEELADIREQARKAVAAERAKQEAPVRPGSDAHPNLVWDQKPLDLKSADFIWAPGAVLADRPAKIAPDDNDPNAGAGKAPGLVVHEPAAAPPALDAAAKRASGGDSVVEGLLQLIARAQHDLLIVSPYFVPGPEMEQAFRTARARGVRIRLLTNSLASNDAPAAYVGYARHREALLAMGVELYELRSEQAGLVSAFGESGSNITGESRSMLHSKALVMDGHLLVVGSMNLDLRSQLQNTEIALLIRSDVLSASATRKIENVVQKGAWHVEQQNGHLVWHAPEGSGVADATHEPDTSEGLRLLLKVIGPLAPEKLL
jgi:cardiolipin synthase C